MRDQVRLQLLKARSLWPSAPATAGVMLALGGLVETLWLLLRYLEAS